MYSNYVATKKIRKKIIDIPFKTAITTIFSAQFCPGTFIQNFKESRTIMCIHVLNIGPANQCLITSQFKILQFCTI